MHTPSFSLCCKQVNRFITACGDQKTPSDEIEAQDIAVNRDELAALCVEASLSKFDGVFGQVDGTVLVDRADRSRHAIVIARLFNYYKNPKELAEQLQGMNFGSFYLYPEWTEDSICAASGRRKTDVMISQGVQCTVA